MLGRILGATAGALAAWLDRSERARDDLRRRVSRVPASVRRATRSAASAAASRLERAAGRCTRVPPSRKWLSAAWRRTWPGCPKPPDRRASNSSASRRAASVTSARKSSHAYSRRLP